MWRLVAQAYLRILLSFSRIRQFETTISCYKIHYVSNVLGRRWLSNKIK